MDAVVGGDEEECLLGGSIDPLHEVQLFEVPFYGDGVLPLPEVGQQLSLHGQEEEDVAFRVVSQVGDHIGFPEFEDLEVVFVDDVEDVFVVDDRDALFVVVEVFAELA